MGYSTNEESETDIYSKEGIHRFVDDDQLSCEEEGFMLGYLEA